MVFDDGGSEPRYVQLARILRDRAIAGHWAVGGRMPSENDLVGEFGINRETARNAMNILEAEGLVVRRKGLGPYLVALPVRREVPLLPGDEVCARMPGQAEREQMGLAPGIPLLVIRRADGAEEKYGAASAAAICAAPGRP
jgi:DNA-binding transcriptional MocR family regulator